MTTRLPTSPDDDRGTDRPRSAGCRQPTKARRPVARSLLLLSLLAGTLAGCSLTGEKQPVTTSLVTCRDLTQQAVGAIEHGDWNAAETLLTQAIGTCQREPSAHRWYAEVLWHRGAHADALAEIDEALRLSADDAGIWVRAGEMRLAMGQLEPAARCAHEALDRDARLVAAWLLRAQVHQRTGRDRDALADYHRALALEPRRQETLLALAEIYRRQNDPPRAMANLESLLDTYRSDEAPAEVLFRAGMAHLALERWDDAIARFDRALEQGGPQPPILYQRALAQYQAGRTREARETASQVLRLDPQHTAAAQLLNQIEVSERAGTGVPLVR